MKEERTERKMGGATSGVLGGCWFPCRPLLLRLPLLCTQKLTSRADPKRTPAPGFQSMGHRGGG